MPRFDRQQLLAVGAFCALLLLCAFVVVGALEYRAQASWSLAEQREQLKDLEARAHSAAGQRQQTRIAVAPGNAFLDAATSGLAAAQFQAYLAQIVSDQHAVLVSSGVPPADRNEKSDAIKLQVTLSATMPALQHLLYSLESGVPYVFVDTLSLQLSGTGEHEAADPVLKVNVTLHAFWHHGTT